MHTQAIRPHDLLWARDLASLRLDGGWPAWLDAAWLARAPLVVRREDTVDGCVPVGVRGMLRSERCMGYIGRDAVRHVLTPEAIAAGAPGHRAAAPAVLAALAALRPALDAIGLDWGPTGGDGFALACGLPVLRRDSDLDLLVRAPRPLNAAQAGALDALREQAGVRIDIQIDTGEGGFAFAEWRRTGGPVLLKRGAGPQLRDDPWEDPA